MVKTNEAMLILTDAKERKEDWRRIALTIRGLFDGEEWVRDYENRGDFYHKAATASGYSESVLRRMVAAHKFYDTHQKQYPAFLDNQPSFPTAETFMRIHKINPLQAKKIAKQVAQGQMSNKEINELYKGFSQGPSFANSSQEKTGKRKTPFKVLASEFITENGGEFYEGSYEPDVYTHFKFEYTRPDCVVIHRDGHQIKWLDGFIIIPAIRAFGPMGFMRVIEQAALSASFFQRLWIIVPAEDRSLEKLTKAVDELKLLSVGVATLSDDGKLMKHCDPEIAPEPNRQAMLLNEILNQGLDRTK